MPIPFPSQKPPPAHSPASSSSSLPSYPSSLESNSDSDSDASSQADTEAELEAMIQEEWEESLRQLEVVLSIVVMPTIGKWFGRMWSYWGDLGKVSAFGFSRKTVLRIERLSIRHGGGDIGKEALPAMDNEETSNNRQFIYKQ
uniref:Uncharacterized protein n=1 Tax=Kwoniella bestiolae CBS 10118 TaxID=1296100 RepID=A0A1B9G4Q8_9TREE|nr:hypothetical protein I302_03670 [Kwoniella bestiolae CBS 10118]OCF25993.1 hypothetical protein I302_03670 [Kwoniella bestiolae CBS 10118]